jgi:hypothetical protein
VGFDDGFGDGEAHACALDAVALALAAVELVEDHLLLHGVDAGAAVGYADGELRAGAFGGDVDGGFGG